MLEIVKQQEKFLIAANNQERKKTNNKEKQLRTVYWMAKEEIAELKFSSLIELQVSQICNLLIKYFNNL